MLYTEIDTAPKVLWPYWHSNQYTHRERDPSGFVFNSTQQSESIWVKYSISMAFRVLSVKMGLFYTFQSVGKKIKHENMLLKIQCLL